MKIVFIMICLIILTHSSCMTCKNEDYKMRRNSLLKFAEGYDNIEYRTLSNSCLKKNYLLCGALEYIEYVIELAKKKEYSILLPINIIERGFNLIEKLHECGAFGKYKEIISKSSNMELDEEFLKEFWQDVKEGLNSQTSIDSWYRFLGIKLLIVEKNLERKKIN